MKIERFYENTAKSFKNCWLYIERNDSGFDNSTYIFDDIKELLNFMSNKIYNIFLKHCDKKELENSLTILDNCNDADSLIEFLNDSIDEGLINDDNIDKIYIENTFIDSNIELEDWIQLRRTAKKYNL